MNHRVTENTEKKTRHQEISEVNHAYYVQQPVK